MAPLKYFEFHDEETLQITPSLLSKSDYLSSFYDMIKEHHDSDTMQLKHENNDNDTLLALHYLLTTDPCDLHTLTTDPGELGEYIYVISYYALTQWEPIICITIPTMDDYDQSYDDLPKELKLTDSCTEHIRMPPNVEHIIINTARTNIIFNIYAPVKITIRGAMFVGNNGVFTIPDTCNWISLCGCMNITRIIGGAEYMVFNRSGIRGVFMIPDECKWISVDECRYITEIFGGAEHMDLSSTRKRGVFNINKGRAHF